MAAAAAIVLCALAAGARPGGGWYSPDTRYRIQTEAFFRGTFALQPVPHGQRADWAWGNGSQQVWGLGVPILRMPGEILARLAGREGFPDRVTLVALVAVVIAVLTRASNGRDPLQRITLVCVVGVFPAFVALLRTRMFVYEEAVAYAYLWAALQLALVIGIASGRSPRWTYAAAAVAGFGPFIRPTMIFYGVATMAIITLASWKRRKTVIVASAIFSVMTLLVLWTNTARFGDPLEFGQRVNVSRWVLDQYAKNFDYPYAHEPLISAGRELLAAHFGAVRFNGTEFYAAGPSIHPWFSSTVRFREFYFSTGLAQCLFLAVIGWALHARRQGTGDPSALAAWWSLMAFALLIGFYIRMPTTTSRYAVDVAASIAGGIVSLIIWVHAAPRRRRYVMTATMAIAATLAVMNMRATISATHTASPLLSAAEAARVLPAPVTTGPEVPSAYRCGDRIDAIGIPFNGVGWNWSGDCGVGAGTTLFISLPRDHSCVTIEADADDRSTDAVAVKFGSTLLERQPGDLLMFCAPPSFRRQPSGIEIASFQWVGVEEIQTRATIESFKVLSIRVVSQK